MSFIASKLPKFKGTKKATPTSSNGSSKAEASKATQDEGIELSRLSLEERVFVLTQRMYKHPENGLLEIFNQLGLPSPDVPERKISVLLLGNHSSGKSTFINWYVGEDVQKTGVAMETSKFTVVCHGKRRETLTANAIVKLFPKLEALNKVQGAMDHLSGEVTSTKNHQFPLVNFIDTPGLVDGERYKFDIDSALDVVASAADLILVFFDTQGQALCQRTLAHLERLCTSQPSKLSLWLTKCDLVDNEADRMKVLQQISTELARRPTIARQALWLTPMYVPGLSEHQPEALNQISSACRLIDSAIATHLQDEVLRKVIMHCDNIDQIIIEKRSAEQYRLERSRSTVLSPCTLVPGLLLLVLVALIAFYLVDRELLEKALTAYTKPDVALNYWDQMHKIVSLYVAPELELPALGAVFSLVGFLGALASRQPRPPRASVLYASETLDKLNKTSARIAEVRQNAEQLCGEFLNMTLDL